MRYAVYMGHGEDPYEVWTEEPANVKREKLSGHKTSADAHAARKRYVAADKRRGE